MDHSQIGSSLIKSPSHIRKYLIVAVLAWSIVIIGLSLWNIQDHDRMTKRIAISEARANFNKDMAFRLWATSHGGVYVPVDENTPPNPYLSHIPERDITTNTGVHLTLMNPAYMVRQLNEFFESKYGITGHITSLKLMRPENAPDDWEKNALHAFEKGSKEVLSFTNIKGVPYLRLMQPMYVKQGCLKCHGFQGYQVGDVRGGVGISLPLTSLIAGEQQMNRTSFISLGFLWLMGTGGLILGGRNLGRRISERDEAIQELQIAHENAIKDQEKRRSLEKQLIQAQKMESLGKLAGGVAHDFNNKLAVILGNSELIMDDLEPGNLNFDSIHEIAAAAESSARLTQQLLAFARQQTITPRILDLNNAIEATLKLLRRLIGENIDIQWEPGQLLKQIKIDPTQLDQIITNLFVNARDAIENSGTIKIETGQANILDLNSTDINAPVEKKYLFLSISDSGCGMDSTTLASIYEPFFTTKPKGSGTGLGLATVYGIVQQNQGVIKVDSDLGKGTTFTVYFPAFSPKRDPSEKQGKAPGGKGETILIVEDELPILEMIKGILTRMGYQVLMTTQPGETLNLISNHHSKIDLIITDVIMPEMNAKQMMERVREKYPEIKCLFMSGYSADTIEDNILSDKDSYYIQKPFMTNELARKLREILD